jgi:hypothetical protein
MAIKLPRGIKFGGVDPFVLLEVVFSVLIDCEVCTENDLIGRLVRAGCAIKETPVGDKPTEDDNPAMASRTSAVEGDDDDDDDDDDPPLLQ